VRREGWSAFDAAMRPPLRTSSVASRPSSVVRRRSSEGDRQLAEAFLGATHPLVVALRRTETALEQLVTVTTVQATGLVLLSAGPRFATALAISTVAAQVALGCRLAALRLRRRQVCLELIVAGHTRLPLACIRRECRRLRDARTSRQLADSIGELVRTATQPPGRRAITRPLADARVLRQLAPELRQIAALLGGGGVSVRGLAAVEWLLTSPTTPLYGGQVDPLREALWRARYLLMLRS
jgi:hypothetical protein